MKRKLRKHPIEPLFIKNSKGKIKSVYIGIESFEEAMKEIIDFEKMIKRKREKEKKQKRKNEV